MDDISQLRSRVAAAQQRMTSAAEEQQKYGLRLADVVRIVEGSLARQKGELEEAVKKAAAFEAERDAAVTRAGTCQAERDVAVKMVAQAQSDLDASETRLSEIELRSTALAAQTVQLAAQNEQLRGMVMTLLQLIEGRSAAPVGDALQRIEQDLRGFLDEQALAPPAPHSAPVHNPAAPKPAVAVSTPAISTPVVPPAVFQRPIPAPVVPPPAPVQQAPAAQAPLPPAPQASASEDNLLLVDINDGPEDDIGSVVAEPTGESSPVAELIRRISEETEEIASPSQRKA
jgi:hypothetical protein